MVLVVRVLVAAKEERPVRGGDLGADLARESDAGFRDPAPLLLHFLALVVIERGEEVGEVAIARILPAELDAVSHHHAGGLAGAGLRFGRKQDVQRRKRRIAAAVAAAAIAASAARSNAVRTASSAVKSRGPSAGVKGIAATSFG